MKIVSKSDLTHPAEPVEQSTISPEQLALAFSNMGDDEQARFFNKIGSEIETWHGTLESQIEGVAESSVLTQRGRYVMAVIGLYSSHRYEERE